MEALADEFQDVNGKKVIIVQPTQILRISWRSITIVMYLKLYRITFLATQIYIGIRYFFNHFSMNNNLGLEQK